MALIDLAALPQLEALTDEARGIRKALETIAECLLKLTAAPEPFVPAKPIGPEAIGSYAQMILDAESETAQEMRQKLRVAGLEDAQIEEEIMRMFRQGVEDGTE